MARTALSSTRFRSPLSGVVQLRSERLNGRSNFAVTPLAGTIVGRAPDAAAQYWMANLVRQGLTPSAVISALIATNELQSRYAQEIGEHRRATDLSTGLGRAPDPTGLANAVALLQSGGRMVTLASTISNSADVRNLCATDTHANWVNTA